MKSQILLALALSAISIAGCGHRSTSVPDDSFRVAVTDLFSSDNERVSVVTVETCANQSYSIRSKSRGLWDRMSQEKAANSGPQQKRVLTFVSSRISPAGAEHDYIKAILRTGEGQVTSTDERKFPRGTTLDKMALTVHDGVYPLSKSLVIGRLYGEDLLLTVGDTGVETAMQ